MRLMDVDNVLRDIEDLKKSPWYNVGKEIESGPYAHVGFLERQEAIRVIVNLFLKDPLTIDAEPVRHGRWIKKEIFHCSECDMPSMRRWPYCEMCGAKMDGDEHEAD